MTDAILAQLRAEIAAQGLSVKAFTVKLGIDYTQYLGYLKGEVPMQVDLLTRSLETLGVDYPVFVARASDRLPPTSGE